MEVPFLACSTILSLDDKVSIIDEVFFFRSHLPMQRVAECAGASNVTLKKWYKNRRA
jgi:hypothetical protein